ncbi:MULTISPECIES: Ni/Fe-hydrogenase, b-type cytochrome subunit [unclassified Bradyrhizobium]|uniref:Ni/Fe-hydrogenase, b-type cytochrome subunit n=1 Tax=unclassified Bradyrhizobium TaxID=2631580 RepID=UPI00247A455D|nr:MULTISPECIES: Ni/Fe-hydrogenase, b-type cytochrome subunit [unclassified Bradyrhizobium]WGR98184.1 Ni/Fe-hydrogenase, b-type cytochrome subunit [Bradyrhizobium sp. ISRA436]WGS05073.1 Ni/Fe-hydrogenase, b-type cytochrome subunit [Bradyrhizobium sp. ISRA437]WGS11958.1 Ni/Fe-hydrogenase, b-type cytochrome subunit [Bradyrhizobium sp. ISRA443]WGS19422.1 Ni/Fe-hydrogenase, b-type cytochrome subunit [Bradyrhizobium sp. ISRA463]WGS26255.1 Ni/Fe-hydrogenase, b-type cytochrome subunit [Bradyrhizobium
MRDKTGQVPTPHMAVDAEQGDRNIDRAVVDVHQAPVRLWHWINAMAILVLGNTGYLIGTGTPAMPGEASDNFLFGYIRFAHFAAGYVLTVGFLLRIYWAFLSGPNARQIFYVPLWRRCFWSELWDAMRWYALLEVKPKRHVGHNPLARLAMFFMFTLTVAFMIVTGLALYAQGSGNESWQYSLFGWVFAIWPNGQDVRTWHHLGLWMVLTFAIVHVYAVIREDIMSRRGVISSMISGQREFRG